MKQGVEFTSQGQQLSGLLEFPASSPKAYALFAHCFTCSKDIAAASRISRALVKKGIAVLRFDFTGLGNSDGDFANTNFSSNLVDLKSASNYLETDYRAPDILIGHSLGGAAVLAVAEQIDSAKAVVTIGAPSTAEHVIHNFSDSLEEITEEGLAKVKLGNRAFTIKKQFIDDLQQYKNTGFNLSKKALLVLHAPLDATVSIAEAEKIYKAAKHPKSFISLDGADHLMTRKEDSEYAAEVISSWVSRYVFKEARSQATNASIAKGHVVVEEKDHAFTLHVYSDNHYWLADEPSHLGGKNLGPDPYEHLLAALGSCTVMTLRLYASKKELPVTNIKVQLSHDKNYLQDSSNCETTKAYTEQVIRDITIEGDLTDEQKQRMLEIADKCPVHKSLHNKILVESKLKS